MTDNLKIYCVTNKIDPLLDDLFCYPAGVGKEKFPSHYKDSKSGDNIHHKDPSYAECIFHLATGGSASFMPIRKTSSAAFFAALYVL